MTSWFGSDMWIGIGLGALFLLVPCLIAEIIIYYKKKKFGVEEIIELNYIKKNFRVEEIGELNYWKNKLVEKMNRCKTIEQLRELLSDIHSLLCIPLTDIRMSKLKKTKTGTKEQTKK